MIYYLKIYIHTYVMHGGFVRHFQPEVSKQSKRDADDAVLPLLVTVTKHVIHPEAYARVLFVDFSSASNSMKTHIPLKRLIDL